MTNKKNCKHEQKKCFYLNIEIPGLFLRKKFSIRNIDRGKYRVGKALEMDF